MAINDNSSIDNSFTADPSNTSLTSNSTFDYSGPTGVVYADPETKQILAGFTEINVIAEAPKISDGIFIMDLAQSHHYTVHIDGMNMSNFKTPTGIFSQGKGFLPVKTMNLKYTSYENMSIPVAIFGDFPLLNKKRVSTIDLTCYDTDKNELEYELRLWEAQCFPKGRFVAYMDDIAREFIYRGYGVDGKQTLEYRVFVIPAGNLSVSRDYSNNEAKIVNFSVVVVGDGRTCASGDGKVPAKDGQGIYEV